jgi:hypothetical protein
LREEIIYTGLNGKAILMEAGGLLLRESVTDLAIIRENFLSGFL